MEKSLEEIIRLLKQGSLESFNEALAIVASGSVRLQPVVPIMELRVAIEEGSAEELLQSFEVPIFYFAFSTDTAIKRGIPEISFEQSWWGNKKRGEVIEDHSDDKFYHFFVVKNDKITLGNNVGVMALIPAGCIYWVIEDTDSTERAWADVCDLLQLGHVQTAFQMAFGLPIAPADNPPSLEEVRAQISKGTEIQFLRDRGVPVFSFALSSKRARQSCLPEVWSKEWLNFDFGDTIHDERDGVDYDFRVIRNEMITEGPNGLLIVVPYECLDD